MSQLFLICLRVSSLQLDRKPSKCVVFEDDPRGITAAHNCTMMAVALIGTHPAYVSTLLPLYAYNHVRAHKLLV